MMRRSLTLQEQWAYNLTEKLGQEIGSLFYCVEDLSTLPKMTQGKLQVAFRTIKRVLGYYNDEPELGFWTPAIGTPFTKKTKEQNQ